MLRIRRFSRFAIQRLHSSVRPSSSARRRPRARSRTRDRLRRCGRGSLSAHSIARHRRRRDLVEPEIVDLARIVQAVQIDVKQRQPSAAVFLNQRERRAADLVADRRRAPRPARARTPSSPRRDRRTAARRRRRRASPRARVRRRRFRLPSASMIVSSRGAQVATSELRSRLVTALGRRLLRARAGELQDRVAEVTGDVGRRHRHFALRRPRRDRRPCRAGRPRACTPLRRRAAARARRRSCR